MVWRGRLRIRAYRPLLLSLVTLGLTASEHHGVATFGGLPVPGATVTLKRGNQTYAAITGAQGTYAFPDLADGVWTIQIEMLLFAKITREITVMPGSPSPSWELTLLPSEEIQSLAAPAARPALPVRRVEAAKARNEALVETADSFNELAEHAADGFLINGSVNNGAALPFAQFPAFGNNRRAPMGLYNGNLGITVDNSALDARSFSLTGQDTAKPAYNHVTAMAAFGGPLKIPHLVHNGPNFFVAYQWTRNRNASTASGLMPSLEQRTGDLSGFAGSSFDRIPPSRISSQAKSLLQLYPLPNFVGGTRYNYQIPIISASHQDSLQSRMNKTIGRKNQLSGGFAFQSTRSDNPNLFGFLDTGSTLGMNATINWRHSFTQRFYGTLGVQYSRLAARLRPYFANRENISAEAGIVGNNQEPLNWGPPALTFADGISPLSDANPSLNRDQTWGLSYGILWNRGRHNLSLGSDFRRQQFNSLAQQDPRGSFVFTGASTGSDFAGFLLGIPDTSSIAFGNADKYFRASAYDGFLTDDWRISPGFTVNAGIRWEYGTPVTERYGRLVNLAIGPGFSSVTPIVARNSAKPLIYPDRHGFQPRIGISWRPFSASSMVLRAGYGVYYNTSVYQSIATQMAQQSPLSKSLSVANGPANPLTLANGFLASPAITPNTFATDPNLLVGYSQNWVLSLERDLPGALVVMATYAGAKGTRGLQEFLPNTYPAGAPNPCLSCPSGFAYLVSNGNSARESGQIQLRRRLHNGFTANLQYTYSKSIDDSALGGKGQTGAVISQDWLDLRGERSVSNFDQRHLLSMQVQYTTGMGIGGGTLLSGWKGALFKEWTFATQLTAGSGLPLTPVYLSPVTGTGVTGPIRPDYTGAPLYAAPAGAFLNPAAYTAPTRGHWGNAGRNSITGPAQFSLNASLGRTFRLGDRLNADLRIDAANALNHVVFPSWNTTITSAQFGLPNPANPMRDVQTTLRVRF
ncbi:MAG: TonB-dependent receptor [Terriglobia bacterium]|nr:MAG: TonB-dependent receptor [Terriglobia bacterium]